MEILCDIEIIISPKEALASQLTFTVLVIPSDIPARVASIGIIADVILNIRYNKLCLVCDFLFLVVL